MRVFPFGDAAFVAILCCTAIGGGAAADGAGNSRAALTWRTGGNF